MRFDVIVGVDVDDVQGALEAAGLVLNLECWRGLFPVDFELMWN